MTTYDVVTSSRSGHDRTHHFDAEGELAPGGVVRVEGRDWLIDRIEGERAIARPARYRMLLRHPDGREERGAVRRFRRDRPSIGHAFTTIEDGQPISWQVTAEQLAHDEQGDPLLELIAERDYSEYEQLPDHELEHALAREDGPARAGGGGVHTRRAGRAGDRAGVAGAGRAARLGRGRPLHRRAGRGRARDRPDRAVRRRYRPRPPRHLAG